MNKYIRWFDEISLSDTEEVGGKNAALGAMIQALPECTIPFGFAIAVDAYRLFLEENKLVDQICVLEKMRIEQDMNEKVFAWADQIKQACYKGSIPLVLIDAIKAAYQKLSSYNAGCLVAVRSSATAEDSSGASFAGQQETFLGIHTEGDLLQAYKDCIASFFSQRSVSYRIEKGFSHITVGMAVGIQKMIRSDKGVSGIAFSLETDTGIEGLIRIESSYGLGEAIVQGAVNPDSFLVHKYTLSGGFDGIVSKTKGDKKIGITYDNHFVPIKISISKEKAQAWSLNDNQIREIAHQVLIIEKYYSDYYKKWCPVDVEWGIDDNLQLFILQARPETVFSQKETCAKNIVNEYRLKSNQEQKTIVTGMAIGSKIVSGKALFIKCPQDKKDIDAEDIIVTTMTDPDWVPLMKKARGIITDQGGRTCHAAIVSRELGICSVVGTSHGTKKIKTGDLITIDCSSATTGHVYEGILDYDIHTSSFDRISPALSTKIMVNCAQPDLALAASSLPVNGVGLARIEFIIASIIKTHPMALLHLEKEQDSSVRDAIQCLMQDYQSGAEYFIDLLARSLALIAAAFYPREVIVRFSDFKTNEYRSLLGGATWEGHEENPMIGLRGAYRYLQPQYQEAFVLECKALVRTRTVFGMQNVHCMVPFVRTVQEARDVKALIEAHGLGSATGCKTLMMCELPGNIIGLEEFAQYFDGFSIGSNDLTQLLLGVDRDSHLFADYNEQNNLVKAAIIMAIDKAKKIRKPIGICGQGPSDFPDFAQLLLAHGINSISLNQDSIISFLQRNSEK